MSNINYNFLIYFFLALFISFYATSRVIIIANEKKIFDIPDGIRKIHKESIPNLGGIGVFLSFTIVFLFSTYSYPQKEIEFFLLGTIFIFLIGIKDDIIPLSPLKRILVQIVVSIIITQNNEFRIQNLHGVFGVYEIPYYFSLFLNIIYFVFIFNAFNLIDGVNGLISFLSIIPLAFYSIMFFQSKEFNHFIICIILIGSIIGFLRYNLINPKIFLGDGGSLFIGFIVAIFSIKYFNIQEKNISNYNPSLIIATSIVPFFDTFRVVIIRILNKRSPLVSDKNHLHHLLLSIVKSHVSVTIILATLTLLITLVNVLFYYISNFYLIVIDFIIMLLFTTIIKKITNGKYIS